ncbi:SdpI family protein [Anaerolentibacter hominis]|uniref:SdpI family protein n=1 Tax=Anaerolentibacter hominis TaxID=3079009 RepID=UPI0031B83897
MNLPNEAVSDTRENKTASLPRHYEFMKSLMWLFMIMPVIVLALVYHRLPEQIPAHMNAAGMIDRYGSRSELWMLPLFTVGFGVFLMWLLRVEEKKEEGNTKVILIVNALSILTFHVIEYDWIYRAFRVSAGASSGSGSNTLLTMNLILGILFIGLGNIFPKLRRNRYVGIRLPWIVSNDIVWIKTHRIGGILFVLTGIADLLATCMFISTIAFRIICVMQAITLVFIIIYSYRLHLKVKKEAKEE